MKRSKLLLFVIAIVAILAIVFVACDKGEQNQNNHQEHVYGAWTITEEPTETTTGTATASCYCGDVLTETVPVLTDVNTWSVETSQDPTHESEGFAIYKSKYGTVTVKVAAGQHVYGAWTITVEPTETAEGKAVRTCACNHYEEKTLAVLTDTEFWTKETVAATHDGNGRNTYTSEYGTVTIVLPQIEHEYGSCVDNGNGTHTSTCTGCDDALIEDCVYDQKVATAAYLASAATCDAKATYYYSCVCGAKGSATFEYGDMLPHTLDEVVIIREATCTETGLISLNCTECDYSEELPIPALGHDFTGECIPYVFDSTMDGYEGGTVYDGSEYHVHVCTRCGEVDSAHKEAHVYGAPEIKVVESGVAGYHSVVAIYTCDQCGYVNTDTDAYRGYVEQSEFWTKSDEQIADYNQAGYIKYTYNSDSSVIATLTIDKLVAPYDGKTYHAVNLNGSSGFKAINAETAWWGATLTVDANGQGVGTAYPFRGEFTITMVDPTTGEISISDGSTSYKGYVDFESGVIVRAKSGSFDDVFVLLPYGDDFDASSVKASNWANAMAIDYVADCNFGVNHTFAIFAYNNEVHFGVEFYDEDGNGLAANECYNQNYVVVMKDGNKVIAFAKNSDDALVPTDGLEGVYTLEGGSDTIVVNGHGGFVLNGNVNGTYTAAADGTTYDFDVYLTNENGVNVAYCQVSIDTDNMTYTSVQPMTTVTYVSEIGTAPEAEEINNNIAYVLPVLENVGSKVFKGWTVDGDDAVITSITPDGTAVTLNAVWKTEVVVTFIGVNSGDPTRLSLGVGDVIGDYLPNYGIDEANGRYFVGWYLDSNGNGAWDDADETLQTDAEISESDLAFTVIAKWNDLPAYYGTYYGTELWYEVSGTPSATNQVELTIGIDGVMTCTGQSRMNGYTITNYDEATQTLTVTKSGSTYYMQYADGILKGYYSTQSKPNTDSDDIYLFVKGSSPCLNSHYGIKYSARETTTKYITRFVEITVGDTTEIVLLYDNRIIRNVSVSDAFGNALTVLKANADSIANSKTVLVRDASGTPILGLAAVNASFSGGSEVQELDAYFGTYTCDEKENLLLDGVGNFVWGDKAGTYTLTSEASSTFDLYVVVEGANTEYHVVTLNTDAKTYVSEQPEVTVSFTSAIDANEAFDSAKTVNKNIAFALPVLTNDTNVFRGWYVDGDDTMTLVASDYVPTDDVSLIAKWDVKYTFVAHYNDGATDDIDTTYGEGDEVVVDAPVWAKHRFDGWFTTATFDEGTEWTSGSAISANTEVWAKWSDAEAWYNTYYIVRLEGNNANGAVTTKSTSWNYSPLAFDAYGDAIGKGFPFASANVHIEYLDKASGKVKVTKNSSEVYIGYLDAATGIIILNATSGENSDFVNVWIMSPFESTVSSYNGTFTSDKLSSSYWNAGKSRAIQYTVNDITYSVFVHNNEVFFNVSFKDADGAALSAETCYNSNTVYVYASDAALIAKFGYTSDNGLVELDGHEGTYTNGSDTIVVDGHGGFVLNGTVNGAYTLANAEYTMDAVIDAADGVDAALVGYYHIILGDGTYTIVKPTVQVTFVSDHGVQPAVTEVNANYAYTLPVLTDSDFIFRGWYVEGDAEQTLVGTSVVLNADVTYVAKWDVKATLTIVYGNGMENVDVEMGANDPIDMNDYVPAWKDGKVFDHWYTSSDNGVTETAVFDATSITENTTVYCAWVAHGPYTIEDTSSYTTDSASGEKTYMSWTYDPETQIWTSGNKGKNSTHSSFKITALTDLTITFQYGCESEAADRYDYLSIKKNGVDVYKAGGKATEITFSETVEVTLSAGDTLEFYYVKDSGGYGNLDIAQVKDLTINGELLTTLA